MNKDMQKSIDNHQMLWKYNETKIQPIFTKLEWKKKDAKNKMNDIAIYDQTCIRPYGLNLLSYFICLFFFSFLFIFFFRKHQKYCDFP